MADTGCEICETLEENPDFTVRKEDAAKHILIQLCAFIPLLEAIVDGVGGVVSTEITPLELTVVDAATIATGAPAYVPGLVDSNDKKYIVIQNKTDAAIFYSLDGGSTDFDYIGPGSTATLNIRGTYSGDVQIRSDAAPDAPTDGNVYISGYY